MPNILDVIVKAAQAPSSTRTALYAARLDAHLETLPDDAARRAYCEQQALKWVSDYEHWAFAVDAGRITVKADGPSAWDYTLTIAAINERKARYSPVLAAGRAS